MFSKRINGRLAVFQNPPVFEIVHGSDGVIYPRGSKFLLNMVNTLEKAKFNITYVPVAGMNSGSPNQNGTYDGLYGEIQAERADFSLMQAPYTLTGSPGKFSSASLSVEEVIVSFETKGLETSQTFMATFYVFTKALLIAILLTVLTFFLYLKWLKVGKCSWKLLSLFMAQYFKPQWSKQVSIREIQLLLIGFVLILRILVNVSFSTDGIIVKPSKQTDTLDDVYESENVPHWFTVDPVVLDFKNKITSSYGKVWSRATKTSLVDLQPSGADQLLYGVQNKLLMSPNVVSTGIKKFLCQNDNLKQLVTQGKTRVHFSKPFATSLFAILYGKRVDKAFEKQIEITAKAYLENGIYGHTWDTVTDEFVANADSCCVHLIAKAFDKSRKPKAVTVSFLPIGHLLCAQLVMISFSLLNSLLNYWIKT